MIVEIRNGKAFASDRGLTMTQVGNVPAQERRYIKERMRSVEKAFAEDIALWREAEGSEFEAWREAEARRIAEELKYLDNGNYEE